MFIKFKKLTIKNCLSYENLEFDFGTGIHLIDGWNEDENTSNGSGKSSIPDLLVWTMYGYMPKMLKDAEIVRYGCETAEATLEFDDSLDNSYVVQRTINPNTLKVWVNGEKIAKENKMTLQIQLIGMLGITYDSFIRTIYMPQNFRERFLMLKDEDRKDILFRIVHLEKFDDIYATISQDLKDLKHGEEVKAAQLENGIKDITNLKEQLVMLKGKADNFSQEKANNIQSVDTELEKLELDLTINNKKADAVRAKISAFPMSLEDCQKQLVVKRGTLASLQATKEQRVRLRSQLEHMENAYALKRGELTHIKASDAPCPYCARPLDLSFVKTKTEEVRLQIIEQKKEIEQLETRVLSIEGKLSDQEVPLLQEIEDLQEFIASNSGVVSELKNLERVSSMFFERIQALKNQRGKLMVARNDFLQMSEENTIKLGLIVQQSKKDAEELQALRRNIKITDKLRMVFGPHGIKAMILDGIVNELNESVREYLDILYDQTVDIKFQVLSHTTPSGKVLYKIPLEFKINDKEWTFNALSGGEKRRAILAVDIALSNIMAKRYGNGCDLLILDEVTTDLDEYSRAKFYELLHYLGREKTIYLIDHATDKAIIKEATMLRVVKQNGISVLGRVS